MPLVVVPPLLFVMALALALVGAAMHSRLTGRLRWFAHALAPILIAASLIASPVWVIDKLLSRLIMPMGMLWLIGFAAVWWLALRGRRAAMAATLMIWLAFTLAGNSWVGAAMLGWVERDVVPLPDDARFDAVMVLGGGTDVTPWGAPQLSHAGDRLRVGAELYAREQTAKLVCSGTGAAGVEQAEARDLAREAADLLAGMGVPREAIVELPGPINTSTEIAALAELARARGWRRIGLVTSAWHLRRAMRLAGRHDLAVTPIPADVRGRRMPASVMGVVPSGAGFVAVQIAWKEIVGAWLGR